MEPLPPLAESSTAIIILNWNGVHDTVECLRSFGPDPEATLVVVDNGSTDGSVERLREEFPDVKLIETGANLGFSAGNNAGIRWAIDEGFDVVGILNNDTLVGRGFVGPLLREIGFQPARTYVSPLIMYVDRPEAVWFGGSTWHPTRGVPVHAPIQAPLGGTRRSDTLTGCALFAHRSLWQRIGLLDDSYFLLFEDAEWSVRANRMGCVGLIVNDSRIRHRVSSTINVQSSGISAYYYARNGVAFLRMARRRRFILAFAAWVELEAIRNLRSNRNFESAKHLLPVARGILDGLRGRGGPIGG